MRRNDTISVGAAVPGYALRIAALVVAVVGAMLLGAPSGWMFVMALVCAIGAVWPQTGGIWLAAATAVVILLLHQPQPGATAIAIIVVHLLHVLASLASVIPMRAKVSLRALAPSGIRFAWMQIVCQAVFFSVQLLPRGPATPMAVLAGAGAALLLGVIAGRMLRAQRSHAFSAAAPRSQDLSER